MGVHSKPTQNERILKYMRDFGSITQIEAIKDLGVIRLPSRIFDLRRKGYLINSEFIQITNRYGEKGRVKRYKLEEEQFRIPC